MKFLTPRQAVEFLREQGYPLPGRNASAGTHLLRLGDRGLVKFSITAGSHRRYTEADLLGFMQGGSTMTQDLIRRLEIEYAGIQAANPGWDMTLWDFLISRKVQPDDIWKYSPQIGYDAGQPEPSWL